MTTTRTIEACEALRLLNKAGKKFLEEISQAPGIQSSLIVADRREKIINLCANTKEMLSSILSGIEFIEKDLDTKLK